MTKTLRIGYGRINQETNGLSPVLTTFADFEAMHFLDAPALERACAPSGVEVPGWTKRAELKGFVEAARKRDVVAVPLLSAWSAPGGPLSRACVDELTARLVSALRAAMPLDGVLLSLHGAMGAEHTCDPESVFLRAVRSVIGDAPIVVTYDMHGYLTDERARLADALVAYKTNPHRDHAAVGRRAGELLIDTARGAVRPVVAWRSLPMLMGGGTTLDFLQPMRGLYARMRAMERMAGVLSTSLLTCIPWSTNPELGWSVAVVADGDRALAERLADELADRAWAVKDALPPAFATADEAIIAARGARIARRLGTVVLADASDVVSAGAPGENTRLVRALVEQAKDLRCYAPLRDPRVVAECWERNPGDVVDVVLGGNLDPERAERLAVRAVVAAKHRRDGFGRSITLTIGSTQLVVVEGPALVVKPSFYADVGLSPWRADIVVVKNFFPFRLFFAPYARRTIYVKTSGITDFDAAHVTPFDGPMHPRDVVHEWRSADLRRRGRAA